MFALLIKPFIFGFLIILLFVAYGLDPAAARQTIRHTIGRAEIMMLNASESMKRYMEDWMIPDAPYIREAELRGTDYMYEWVYGSQDEESEED